jgi:transposase
MRGEDQQQNHMFSYLSPEARVRKDHPLRAIRAMVDEVLTQLSRRFDGMYATVGRPSIAPEKLLRAQLLQMLYSIRSERLLMEEMDYNLLFRWFVGLNADDEVWDATTSPRTATACWRPTWPRSFWRAWWRKRGEKG